MNMPTYVVLLLISIFVLIFFALVVSPIVKKMRISVYIKNNPDYVKMRVFSRSNSSFYSIIVFSVNDQKPLFGLNGTVLYMVPGKNRIIAQYKTESEYQKTYPMIGSLVGGIIGAIISLVYLIKTSKNSKIEKPENGITIDIETKRNGYYEMKADPYKEIINITCFEGENHDIKSFK